jgi:hypothetical protein
MDPASLSTIGNQAGVLTVPAKHFWFRTRYITASAFQVTHLHPHIIGLDLQPSTLATLITSAVSILLPTRAQSWTRTTFPEWFLPSRVVIKQQKPGEAEIAQEYFDTERAAYTRLKPLQGVVIPRMYGSLHYHGTRALMLDYLDGVSLPTPEGGTLELEELSALLQGCYRALDAFGVQQDDSNLSNFLLVGGTMMVLDLESAVFHYSADDRAFFTASSIGDLAGKYGEMQAYYRHDGCLEAA